MARPLYKNLTVQVLAAIAIGLTIGVVAPDQGIALKPLGEGFVNLVKMMIAPIIFCTIVVGIASMRDLKRVGRVGGKALLYFEVITTLALAIGLLVGAVLRPGDGVQPRASSATANPATQAADATSRISTQRPSSAADQKQVEKYAEQAKDQSTVKFLMGMIPDTLVSAFMKSDQILQVLLVAILVGIAVASMGERAAGLVHALELIIEVLFRVVSLIMKVAPLGAMGAMAYMVGTYGIGALSSLAKLMVCMYLTMGLFIFVVLGAVCRIAGFRLLTYLAFIKDEILLVLGTSSSESALPGMMKKMERLGCEPSVVGMVIPAGYSFNLDGTSIYLSMALLFIAQAMGVELSLRDQIYTMAILMLTSKGAAAVTGGGFITLSATFQVTHILPPEQAQIGLTLILGVDRFMSEARAITNLIGNGIATLVVSKWEGAFDQAQYDAATSESPPAE